MTESQLKKQLGPVEARIRELLKDHPYEKPEDPVTETSTPQSETPNPTTGNSKQDSETSPENEASQPQEALEPVSLEITGPTLIQLKGFGETTEPIILRATSTAPTLPISWRVSSDELTLQKVEKGDPDYQEGATTIEVWANAVEENKMVELVFEQELSSGKISQAHNVQVQVPRYFYLPPCKEWLDMGIISNAEYEQCLDQSDDCADKLDEQGDIILENDPAMVTRILQEHVLSGSAITDQDLKLRSEKLNYVRKLWKEDGSPYPAEEAGELREFVKKAPCTSEWFRSQDRKDLIELGKEGIAKLKPLEDQIEQLEKGATAENYAATQEKIEQLEIQQDTLRAQYERSMNRIAAQRNIIWSVSKSDTNHFYRPGEQVTVFGVTWKGGKAPRILLEVPFTPVRKKKVVTYSADLSKSFWLDIKYLGITFVDGTDDPLQYGFSQLDRGFKEGLVPTFIKFENFLKEINSVDYYMSKAKATPIQK